MHYEILIEDQSGQRLLEILLPKIIENGHTFKIHAYKGIGRIPRNLTSANEANRRCLLDQLPRLLNAYGRTFPKYPEGYFAAVIVVCDLDNRCLVDFRQELLEILNSCDNKPQARFCIAIEEGEAWLLGDIVAVKTAYPKAKEAVLKDYVCDSICGTWECLANALYPGGSAALSAKGWHAVGAEKSEWAKRIGPCMNVENNASNSFAYFRRAIRDIAAVVES